MCLFDSCWISGVGLGFLVGIGFCEMFLGWIEVW